jgi:hypothetical protein
LAGAHNIIVVCGLLFILGGFAILVVVLLKTEVTGTSRTAGQTENEPTERTGKGATRVL